MDVQMPDGTTIQGVPDGTTRAQLGAQYEAHLKAPQPTENAGPNGVPLPEGSTLSAPVSNPAVDAHIDRSPVGRILDSFGQGMKDGWGTANVGVSPETEQALKKIGMDYPGDYHPITSPLKTFNEVMMRPAAAALHAAASAGDVAGRGVSALLGALGAATGQAMDEGGITKALVRDPSLEPGRTAKEFGGGAQMIPYALGIAGELGVLAKAPEANGPKTAPMPPEEPQVAPTAPGEAAPSAPPPANPVRPAMAATDGLTGNSAHTSFDQMPETNKAGNINLDNIQASGDVKDIIRKTAVDNGGFMDARRGVISLAQTEQLADALGMTSESLNGRKIGTAFNAEEITTARNMLVQSATNVRDLASKVSDGDEASLQAFVEAEAKHKAIQEQVAGVTAEGGRALSAFRINAKATGEAQDFSKVLEGLGDSTDDAAARAKAIGELDTPNKVSAFINSTRKPTFKDQFLEYWINGLLSGPATHTTYAESNALLALWKGGLETPVAGAIGAARQAASSAPVDRVFMGETGARMHGFVQGGLEGIPAAWRAIKSGVTEALPGEEQQPNLTPKIPGMAGQVITVPSRVIAGIHTFGRAIGYRQEINALAYRQAARAGLEGDDFATQVAQTKANPSDDMMTQATEAASAGTMMTKPNGGFGAKLESLANANIATKMVAPFVRVGLNIVNQGLVQRTPLGLLSSDVRETLMGEHGAAARDTQIARMGVGTALGAAVMGLASQGLITGGGPSDPKAAAVWRMTGRQPYSVQIGGTWYGYHRLGSLGQIVGVAADMHEIGEHISHDDATSVATLLTNSVAKNMVDETWMRGPADLIEALRDPDRYGASYVRNQLATLVPFSVGMGQMARAIDPLQRNASGASEGDGSLLDVMKARGIVDAVKAKVPFLSETLRPRYDLWGQPMQNQGNPGPDALSAIAESRVNNDPVNQELVNLGISPSRPEQKIRGVKLTPDQYDDYQMIAGRLAKSSLDSMVNSEGWSTLPEYMRQEAIENTMKSTRQAAEGYMQMRNLDLIAQGINNRVNQIRGIRVAK